MPINWTNVFIAGIILTVVIALFLFFFPLNYETNEWDFTTHSYKTETNYFSIIAIVATAFVLFIWLSSKPSSERSIIRHPRTILKSIESNVQEILADHNIVQPIYYHHTHPMGEFSLGFIWLVSIWNADNKLVCLTILGNDNYNNSELKTPFESPILSDSEEYYDIKSATRFLQPSERGTLATRLKSLYKELKNEDSKYAETILKKASEEAEEEIEEE